jgi:hypothetical protein
MIIDILAVIIVGAVGLRYLAKHEVKPTAKLTDEQKLELRRREAVRLTNAKYEHDQWWV